MHNSVRTEADAFRDSRRLLRRVYCRSIKKVPEMRQIRLEGGYGGELRSLSIPPHILAQTTGNFNFKGRKVRKAYDPIPVDLRRVVEGPFRGKSMSQTEYKPCFDAWEIKRLMGFKEMDVPGRVYSSSIIDDTSQMFNTQSTIEPPLSPLPKKLPTLQDILPSIERLAAPRKKLLPRLPTDCFSFRVPLEVQHAHEGWLRRNREVEERSDLTQSKWREKKESLTAESEEHMRNSFRGMTKVEARNSKMVLSKGKKEKVITPEIVADFEAMKKMLVSRYRTIEDAWRQLLDPERLGRIAWTDFAIAMRHIGYKGNLKGIWMLMDKNLNGQVELVEICPRADKRFKEQERAAQEKEAAEQAAIDKQKYLYQEAWKGKDLAAKTIKDAIDEMRRRFGSVLLAWDLMDPNGKKYCALSEFADVLRCCNFRGDIKAMYKVLDVNGDGILQLEELSANAAKEFDARAKNRAEQRARDDALWKRQNTYIPALDPGNHKTLADLKKLILHRFQPNGILQAWKEVWDVHDTGKITIVDFANGCRQMGFKGPQKQIFAELDKDKNGSLSLLEIDPASHAKYVTEKEVLNREQELVAKNLAARIKKYEDLTGRDIGATSLADIKRLFLLHFQTTIRAWRECLDIKNRGWITRAEFAQTVRMFIGFKGNTDKVFDELDKNNDGHFTIHELDEEAGKLYDQQEEAKFKAMQAYDEKKAKIEHDDEEWMKKTKEKILVADCKNVVDLRKYLRYALQPYMKAGSSIMDVAWKELFDPLGSGSLTKEHFCGCLRKIGTKGDYRKLWLEVDVDGNGFATKEELFGLVEPPVEKREPLPGRISSKKSSKASSGSSAGGILSPKSKAAGSDTEDVVPTAEARAKAEAKALFAADAKAAKGEVEAEAEAPAAKEPAPAAAGEAEPAPPAEVEAPPAAVEAEAPPATEAEPAPATEAELAPAEAEAPPDAETEPAPAAAETEPAPAAAETEPAPAAVEEEAPAEAAAEAEAPPAAAEAEGEA